MTFQPLWAFFSIGVCAAHWYWCVEHTRTNTEEGPERPKRLEGKCAPADLIF